MIALHMGGIPETAMVLGPLLLIAAFIRIARRHEAETPDDDHDDWDPDLGDLPGVTAEPARPTEPARSARISEGSEPA
jgi:hypothetical protein